MFLHEDFQVLVSNQLEKLFHSMFNQDKKTRNQLGIYFYSDIKLDHLNSQNNKNAFIPNEITFPTGCLLKLENLHAKT